MGGQYISTVDTLDAIGNADPPDPGDLTVTPDIIVNAGPVPVDLFCYPIDWMGIGQASGSNSWWVTFAESLVSDFGQTQLDARKKGYYSCLAKEMGLDTAKAAAAKLGTELLSHFSVKALEHNPPLMAGVYFQYIKGDGRFTNLGRASRVLVPDLAPKIAAFIKVGGNVVSLSYLDYEGYKAIGKCSELLK